jgi:hypothetical protein
LRGKSLETIRPQNPKTPYKQFNEEI